MREPDVLDAEIRAYLEAENAYTAAILAPVADLKERVFEEIKGRIKEDDSSVPAPDGGIPLDDTRSQAADAPELARCA